METHMLDLVKKIKRNNVQQKGSFTAWNRDLERVDYDEN